MLLNYFRGRSSEDRPPYFQFLTILAFNIFIREKVDVAIIGIFHPFVACSWIDYSVVSFKRLMDIYREPRNKVTMVNWLFMVETEQWFWNRCFFKLYIISRERGIIRILITLVPKVLQYSFLISWLKNFWYLY